MKLISEVRNEIVKSLILEDRGDKDIDLILKKWAESIIDECARIVVDGYDPFAEEDIIKVKEQL